MKSQAVTVLCENGLHARVAAQVVKAMRNFDAIVSIRCRGCTKANARSILELLTLDARQGMDVEIEADGTEADAALGAITEIFEHGGGI